MKENLPKEESLEDLEKTSGGDNFGTAHAVDICIAIGNMYSDMERIEPPQYPCPKCGSWNVGNYDPGTVWQMRVYCKDCGFYGCRDGGDDVLWSGLIWDKLRKLGYV